MNQAVIDEIIQTLRATLRERLFDVAKFEILVTAPPALDDLQFYNRLSVEVLGRSDVGMWRWYHTAVVDKEVWDAPNVVDYLRTHFKAELVDRLRGESEGVGLYLSLKRTD